MIFGIFKQAPNYFRDSEGDVYQWINGVIDTPSPFVKCVGKLNKISLPKDFDAQVYNLNKLSPIYMTMTPSDNGLFSVEVGIN